jgi:hypothetical protein
MLLFLRCADGEPALGDPRRIASAGELISVARFRLPFIGTPSLSANALNSVQINAVVLPVLAVIVGVMAMPKLG